MRDATKARNLSKSKSLHKSPFSPYESIFEEQIGLPSNCLLMGVKTSVKMAENHPQQGTKATKNSVVETGVGEDRASLRNQVFEMVSKCGFR